MASTSLSQRWLSEAVGTFNLWQVPILCGFWIAAMIANLKIYLPMIDENQ
ncbi:MAG: hypothetical protein ACKPCM_11725 [Pseudanabaena sp.]